MIIYKEKGTPFGIDISDYNATLIDRLITPMNTIPNSFPARPASKTFSLKFRIDGKNELDIMQSISRITKLFQRCEMEFKDMKGYRTAGENTGTVIPTKVNNHTYLLDIDMMCELTYKFQSPKVTGTGTLIEYNNAGTWESPFKLQLNIMQNTDFLEINVGKVSMQMTNLKAGNVLIVDTLEMRILLNGGDNIDIMTTSIFPSLPIGEGTISLSQECHYKLEYREVWM